MMFNVDPADGYRDGHAVYLLVQTACSSNWVQRIAVRGSQRQRGLGGAPTASLQESGAGRGPLAGKR